MDKPPRTINTQQHNNQTKTMSTIDVEAPFGALYDMSGEASVTAIHTKKAKFTMKCTPKIRFTIIFLIGIAIMCGTYALFAYVSDSEPDQRQHSYGKRVMVFQSSRVIFGSRKDQAPKFIYTYKYNGGECGVTYYTTVSKPHGIPKYGELSTFYRYDTSRCSETLSDDWNGGVDKNRSKSTPVAVILGTFTIILLLYNLALLNHNAKDVDVKYEIIFVQLPITIATIVTFIVFITTYNHPMLPPDGENPLMAECDGEIGFVNATAHQFMNPDGVETIFFDADGVWCPYDVADGKYVNGTVYQILAYTSDPVCDFRNLQSNNTCGRAKRSSLAGKIKTF